MTPQHALRPPALRLPSASGTPALDRRDRLVVEHGARLRAVGTERSIRVLLAEGQPLMRAGYRAVIESEDRIAVVGEAATVRETSMVAAQTRPDVLLLDLALPGLEDLETTARVVSHPALAGVAVMVMASLETEERVICALRAGAVGVILGIYALARGSVLISAKIFRRLLREQPRQRLCDGASAARLEELTNREREVLALVGRGMSDAEIAEQLAISPATAKTHVSRAMGKFGIHHRAQLVVLAYETGLSMTPSASWRPLSEVRGENASGGSSPKSVLRR
jgi:DNA-binding NarL/FixJ family response regulator